MATPQNILTAERQKMLEEKLKVHIQREYDLGEKVIGLLKQKKQLEETLQEQQTAHSKLEGELAEIAAQKNEAEQNFSDAQKSLHEQQRTLKSRSRLIQQDEEQSRGTLEQLHRQIDALREELQSMDSQKQTEQAQLAEKIIRLQRKEQAQQQKLHQLVTHRDEVEKRLAFVVKKYKRLALLQKQQKKQHEQQLESLYQEQIHREARIELLRDEQKVNEEALLKEIETLKEEKAALQAKLGQQDESGAPTTWANDENLLQVIERQNQYIQELKDKAHQRSVMLREENDALRKEMDDLASSQDKVKWENHLLETSLKDLQSDLTEYMNLKQKFDAVQREKENFEKMLQRRLHLFEEQQEAAPVKVARELPAATEIIPAAERPGTFRHWLRRVLPKKRGLFSWMNMGNPRLLNAVLFALAIFLAFWIYQMIPWRYMQIGKPTAARQEQAKRVILDATETPEGTAAQDDAIHAQPTPEADKQATPAASPTPTVKKKAVSTESVNAASSKTPLLGGAGVG